MVFPFGSISVEPCDSAKMGSFGSARSLRTMGDTLLFGGRERRSSRPVVWLVPLSMALL